MFLLRPNPGPVKVFLLVAMCLAVICIQAVAVAQNTQYPAAKRGPVTDNYHGTVVADPYRWMEDMESAETRQWIDQQEALLESYVEDVNLRSAIRDRILAIRAVPQMSTPAVKNGRYFYTRREYGQTQGPLYMRAQDSEQEQVLFDPHKELNEDQSFPNYTLSPDGRYLAIFIRTGQSPWQAVQVMEVARRKILPHKMVDMRFGITWRKDGKGFFYVRYQRPPASEELTAALENPQIFYHDLHQPQSRDRLVFALPEHPTWLISPQVSTDGRYMLVNVAKGSTFSGLVDQVYVMDLQNPQNGVRQLLGDADGKYSFEGNNGSTFWMQTTVDAPHRRFVAFDIAKPKAEYWEDLVPEADEILNSVSLIGDYFVMRYTRDALPVIRVHQRSGKFAYEVKLPSIAFIGGLGDDPDSNSALYSLWGLYENGTTYQLDLKTGKSKLFGKLTSAYNPQDFVMKQVFYRSKDGTRVPMIIAHHEDTKPGPDSPLFMYGYGALAWSALPWYQPHIVAWTEMGGIYALPGIRGGGEYGDEWYQAGIGKKKQNGIDDFIAAAEWLIKNNYTSSKRIVANGGSASGVLAGAAMIQRPDLFGASVIDIPRFDMLRYHLFTGGTARVKEIGSPDDPEMFPVIHRYSPYHNIKPGECYPPMLVIAGEKDAVAPPLHAYKMTAAMQANAACRNPYLLKIVRGAGHNYGITHEQNAQTWADAWSFLIKTLDLGESLRALPSSPAVGVR